MPRAQEAAVASGHPKATVMLWAPCVTAYRATCPVWLEQPSSQEVLTCSSQVALCHERQGLCHTINGTAV